MRRRPAITLACGRALLGASLLAVPLAAGAAEHIVYGDVIAVEAVDSGAPATPCTAVPRPARGEGLAATLRWDLAGRSESDACRAGQASPGGYRVTYRWNGHEFTDVLPEDPGRRIALTLEID